MKKYLVLFFLLASLTSFGQFSNYTNINGRYKWIAGKFDSTFTLPSGTTPSLRVGGGTGPGALFYSTTDSTIYQYTGTRWTRLRGTDTAHVVSAYVRNTTASTMTAGQVVYINGSTGTTPTIALAVNTADSTSAMTFGFVRGTIAPNAFGWITTFGPLEGVNTNAYTEGEVIYLDSIPGQFTHDKPQAPYHMVTLGYIVKNSGGNGTIFAKIQNGYELEELHNVRITAPVLNKSVIIYDSVKGYWVDTTVSAAGLGLGGSGTTNYLSKWTSSSALGNSLVQDDGTRIGLNGAPVSPYPVHITAVSGYGLAVRNGTTTTKLTQINDGAIGLGDGSGNYATIENVGTSGTLRYTSAIHQIRVGTTNAIYIPATANVLIGTTTDGGYKLQVSGTTQTTALRISNGNIICDNSYIGNAFVLGGTTQLYFYNNTNGGVISANQGPITAYFTVPQTNTQTTFVVNDAGGAPSGYKIQKWMTGSVEKAYLEKDGNLAVLTSGLFGSIGSVNASAVLEATSTTKGFLPPRMTNAQMLAIATPAAGLVVYDTTNNKLNVYDGTNWVAVH